MELLSICGVLVRSLVQLHLTQLVYVSGSDCNFMLLFCIGCILAELYTGYPLFPGENEVEQLACIMEVLGTPPDHIVCNATRRRLFFGEESCFVCLSF